LIDIDDFVPPDDDPDGGEPVPDDESGIFIWQKYKNNYKYSLLLIIFICFEKLQKLYDLKNLFLF
jgi:hypothetical protein